MTESPTAEGPCYGPLSFPESALASIDAQAPGLSANGYTVAFLAGSELRPDSTKPDALDVFLTSMAPGLTRKAATNELTLAVRNAEGDGGASITSLALSADGSHIAFVSQRNVFPLAEPELLGSLSETAQESELYVIDLTTDTLERAVLGIEDSQPDGSVESNPTLSEDGAIVAFDSAASNLIAGDANGVADAFLASYEQPSGTATPSSTVNTPVTGFSLGSEAIAELHVNVKRGRHAGEEVLTVDTPGPGKLSALAKGKVAVAKNAARSNGKGAKKAKQKRVTLANAHKTVRSTGTTKLVLRLAAKYVTALERAGELKATVSVAFKPAGGGEALSDEVTLSFQASKQSVKRAKKHST